MIHETKKILDDVKERSEVGETFMSYRLTREAVIGILENPPERFEMQVLFRREGLSTIHFNAY